MRFQHENHYDASPDEVVAMQTDQAYRASLKSRTRSAGHTVTVTVRDLCPGCAANSLDLTSSAFQQLAPLSVGNIPVSWSWV